MGCQEFSPMTKLLTSRQQSFCSFAEGTPLGEQGLAGPRSWRNALGDSPAFQEATGHGGASPELGLWQFSGASYGQKGVPGSRCGGQCG